MLVSVSYVKRIKLSPYLIAIIIPVIIGTCILVVTKVERVGTYINLANTQISENWRDWKNIDQRTREWYTAMQLISDKPLLGHGLGKIQERLFEEYINNGWVEEAELRLNAHNQFLEAQMTFGIAGSFSLLWMLLTPIFFRKQLRFPSLAIAFVIMFSFFLLFESMFNRQWGIMFFTLFYCLLVFPIKNDAIKVGVEDLNNQKNN